MEGILNKHFGLVRNIYIYILLAAALLLLILFPVYIKEDGASAVTGTANSSSTSLTLTTSNTSANVTVTPNSANGTFAMSSTSNEAKFSVTTNNYTGYELRIKADDDTGNLTNIDGGVEHTIFSIDAPITKSSFDTTTYNNKWGFKPNKYLGPNSTIVNNTGDSAVFLPSPTTTGTVLDHTTTPNTTANNYTIALGIRVDNNTYSGSYAKTFTLVATANPTTYTINYNKNTTDSVSNLPSTSTAGSTTATSITLPNTVPTRAHYSFLGWCSTTTTTTNGVDSCSGTVYNPNGAGTNLTYGLDQTTANTTTLYAMWKIDTFTQTTEVRYENADGTWGSYNTVDTQTLNYGASYSWSTAQINNFDSTTYQAASVSSYTVTEAHTNQVSIYRNTFTCTKQYRLENADGTWGAYTTASTEVIRYGGSCNYIATITDYRGSSSAANGAQGSISASNITANTTISLDFYRNTYTLTVSAGSNTSSPTGSGTYRWGQAVSVGVAKATDVTCTSYATPTWTQSGTAGTFSSTSGTSTTFTMGKGNTTVTATSTASNVSQTITLSRSGGASGINIGGANYTGSSVSLTCGTYNISGNYSSGYEFSSWSRSGSITVANTASATTTMTVSGSGTLTLAGKSSCSATITGTMQDFKPCSSIANGTTGTLTDSRDGTSYAVGKLADGKFWLLDNLALDLTNTTTLNGLSTVNTNASAASLTSLKSGNRSAGNQYATAGVANWTSGYSYSAPLVNANFKDQTTYLAAGQSGTGKRGVYYNFCAASAGSYCYGNGASSGSPSGNATEDICPAGWRMPTGGSSGEYQNLENHYYSIGAFVSALRVPVSGTFYNGSMESSAGQFFSSTRQGSDTVMILYSYNTGASSFMATYLYVGASVRCILK